MTDANPDALDNLPDEDEDNSTEDINLIQSNPLDLEDPTESKLNGSAQGPVLDNNETCDPIKKEASEETLDMQKTSVLDKAKPVDEENNSKAVGNAEMIKATVPSDSSCSDMGEPSINEETREHSMTETRETRREVMAYRRAKLELLQQQASKHSITMFLPPDNSQM
ncbi:interferon-induced very large GTPase 1-like protein [Labeo rohita]|uniref:Interferon-induced very large GTPase 1-like protein n=1 Tax=Labeo rohita TaxID=84645 RepID=A0A498P1M3_LABRO|nr:interferon-induced very large GTPase 1-like protein [Labeo rohita]